MARSSSMPVRVTTMIPAPTTIPSAEWTFRSGTVSLDSQFIKLGPINIASGATLTATQPWATGASNPWFNGRSVGPITVQAGGTLTTTVCLNGIMEGLTLLGGSVSRARRLQWRLGGFHHRLDRHCGWQCDLHHLRRARHRGQPELRCGFRQHTQHHRRDAPPL